LLPQPRQAHRGTQFQGLGLLVTGNRQRLVETDFGLDCVWGGRPQQEFALEPIQLCLIKMLRRVVHDRQPILHGP
jgi:hypothetical protein